jgi:cardiolipin synthase
MIVDSTLRPVEPLAGAVLFQTLLASAGKSIHITTPYFLPDYSIRQEMIRAITGARRRSQGS